MRPVENDRMSLSTAITGNISEKHWDSLAKAIDATTKQALDITFAATVEGCRSFTYMTGMWRTAQQNEWEARKASPSVT